MIEGLNRDRFAAANGIELLEARPGYARTRLTPSDRHRNCVDLIHGGALFTLAATAFFAAVNSWGKTAVGINMTLSCLNPARDGTLEAEATEVSRSRRLSTCAVRITDTSRQLIALFQGTAYIKDDKFPREKRVKGEGGSGVGK
jgi:acyl-CoA thioesterase